MASLNTSLVRWNKSVRRPSRGPAGPSQWIMATLRVRLPAGANCPAKHSSLRLEYHHWHHDGLGYSTRNRQDTLDAIVTVTLAPRPFRLPVTLGDTGVPRAAPGRARHGPEPVMIGWQPSRGRPCRGRTQSRTRESESGSNPGPSLSLSEPERPGSLGLGASTTILLLLVLLASESLTVSARWYGNGCH